MPNNYILTSDGSFISEDEYLQHWGLKKGEAKEDHKYIKREWKNGRWQYYYETTGKANVTIGAGSPSAVKLKMDTINRHDLKGLTKLADWAGADEKVRADKAHAEYTKAQASNTNRSYSSADEARRAYKRENELSKESTKAKKEYSKTLLGRVDSGKQAVDKILKKTKSLVGHNTTISSPNEQKKKESIVGHNTTISSPNEQKKKESLTGHNTTITSPNDRNEKESLIGHKTTITSPYDRKRKKR